ncbi:MAG TPA: TolC family protein [Candidatus Binatia bacterium]|nr:TolC family protein [Candidatus Binatia bacterium]
MLAILVSGCGGLLQSVRDPYALAPPAPSRPWTPPDSTTDAPAPRVTADTLAPDPDHEHDLPDLIDLAERANPETRRAWEQARAAAASLGITESAYLPTLALLVEGSSSRTVFPTPTGEEIVRSRWEVEPGATLEWMLLDFGRRGADRDRALEQLRSSTFTFNRVHQEVAFGVQRSFYAYDAARARVTAARATLEAASGIAESSEAKVEQGLGTQPDLLLARQELARAAFELQDAEGDVSDAHAELTERLGLSPTVRLRVRPLDALPLPAGLPETVERVIDTALANRPDLAARLATLRAREADIRRARAEYMPRVGLTATGGGDFNHFRSGKPFATHTYEEPLYSATLGVEWQLFDGFERQNRLLRAESEAGAARADLATLELRALREVWTAYADVKTALRKQEFAEALLRASEDAYGASMESYQHGLGTLIDLLAAQRDLARARTTVVETRAGLLTAAAALAFASGAMPDAGSLP